MESSFSTLAILFIFPSLNHIIMETKCNKKSCQEARKGMIKIEDEIKFLESLRTYNWYVEVDKRLSELKQS